ncbi:MAG TPA: hypothetical protein VH394_30260 [Thermoanaerobaculia bacterium]|jgi:hypothetical protein|nr:hypothetical protein [Thermoanaerobaculia bacterium]
MREQFGNWGIELSDADFACALAALGMLPPEAEPSWPVDRLADALLRSFQRRRGWQLRPTEIDARTLAETWLSFLDAGGRGTPIHIESPGPVDPYWIEGQLSRPEVGAGPVQILMSGAKPNRELTKGLGSYAVDTREEVSEPGPRPRFLQAQLQREPEVCTVSIRVGLPDEEWRSVEKSFPLPEDSDPDGHQLTVLFSEPRVCPEPQVRSLWLPPRGSSQPVSFTFEIPRGLSTISARVTILHANRVLQTGLLEAEVGRGLNWTFRIDAAPRRDLESLSGRTVFDAALVEGDGITAAAEGSAALLHLDDGQLDDLTRFLTRQISSAANDPDSYAQLDSPGSVELLRILAQKGGEVHETLCEHTGLAALANAKRIHITAARVGSFFPVELLYSFEPPDDTAGLCPRAAEALQRGECAGDCSVDRRQNICPLGFWGLSRIIERHAHRREDNQIDGDFLLQPEPVRQRSPLPVSGTSLLAASGRATEVKATAVDELFEALQKRGPASRATSWKAWASEVSEDSPSLLVLLPHHEQSPDEEILEIGQGDRLRSELVRVDHVRQPSGPYPILLLLGCETNLARIAFDNFVTRFRDKGAAVVVSTIATVLGRQASPAAARLVELLDEAAHEGNSTFGEVMLRLRQKLVATQTPMALGLTAYGDADWVLTRERASAGGAGA